MLHHLSLGVSAIYTSVTFYDAVLGALGYVRVWSDLAPGTDDQAVGYGWAGGGDKLALKQSTAVPLARAPASISPSAQRVPLRWTRSTPQRCSTAAAATARRACGRTMAMTTTPPL